MEVDLAPGLPGIQLVGLPDKAIQESRERVPLSPKKQWLPRSIGAALSWGDRAR